VSLEPLCARTFCEAVRPRMNKKTRTKNFYNEKNFIDAGASGKEFDGSKDIHFFPLLFKAVMYIAVSNGELELPDVSAKMVSELKNGMSEVHPKIIEIAQRKETLKAVGEYFAINLIPNMTKAALTAALDAIDTLVMGDVSLGKTLQKMLAAARKNKTPADYLAEVWINAITLGRNRIEAERGDSALDTIRSNSRVWFEKYKKDNAISVDSAILPEIRFESGNCFDLCEALHKRESTALILLLGEGGIGKSYALFDCCTKLLGDKAFLPLYIPMRELSRTDESPVIQYAFDRFFSRLD